ncbi:MAG TPA: sulfite exporter TauE/SafE family protein [Gemmatimonadaceae bacterium]|nr:sulfite exporter TauE/SafE family protein [Gemmatimonadaceae bacterium]
MSELSLLAITALTLGAIHSFAPDHLAAVSIFVTRRPGWRRALSLGARWGLGHSLIIVLLGTALAVSGARLPDRFASAAERIVGMTLIVLGVIALWRAKRLHGHWHVHDGHRHWHLHAHRADQKAAHAALHEESHRHEHKALLGIGMLHGLAGTGALVVALPVAASITMPRAVLFLTAFGVGTIVAMALFGAAAGWLMHGASRLSSLLHRGAIAAAGLTSIAVGAWWLAAGGA